MTGSLDTRSITDADMLRYNAAYDAFNNGSHLLAQEMLLPLVQEYPHHASLNMLFASCLDKLGRSKEAYEHIQRIHLVYPQSATVLLRIARIHVEKGDRRGYRKILRRIVALGQTDRDSWLAYAHLKYDLGSFHEAYPAYTEAFGDPMLIRQRLADGKITPKQAEYYYQIFIRVLSDMGMFGYAQTLSDQFLQLSPHSKKAVRFAVYAAQARGDIPAAVSHLLQAKAAAPEERYFVVGLAVLSLQRFYFREAFRYFRDLTKKQKMI